MQNFNIYEYLDSFKTKQEIKDELARLQRNMDNLPFRKLKYHQLLARKKLPLVEKFNREYCTREYYMDDLGRTHWYYIEIEEWQKLHNITHKGTKVCLDG